MKYAQLVIGLFAGVALGGSVVAATDTQNAGNANPEAIKKIVRETISTEPQLILESVQKFQEQQRTKEMQGASEALKDPSVQSAVFDRKNVGTTGATKNNRIIVEFFDYNCPACKMQYKALQDVLAKDKDVLVMFREFPIFGPVSDMNAKLGIAVARIAPDKYFGFYQKMMLHEGKADEAAALGYIKALGMDVEKVKAEAQGKDVAEAMAHNQMLGEKLQLRGTPSLVIGDQLIAHAIGPDEIEAMLAGGKK